MQEFTPRSLSATLAAHVVATSFDDIPPVAIHAARRALLDALGVSLAATGLSAEARPYRNQPDGPQQGASRLLGSSHRRSPAQAAFANGALAHALDFGDCFDAGPAHPHAALVPALMALADIRPSITFGQFLAALAIGGDLACRLSLAPARPYETGGWYPPPLVNLISSAAACAKLLGLDTSRVMAAMSFALLSGSFPAALKHDRGSPLRGMREAFAARGAVEAALLAEAGAAGFSDPLGGPGGFFEVYGGGCRAEVLLEDLGQRFLGAEVSFKPWPACRGTHAYIEAALELRLMADHADIQAVTAGIGPIQEMLVRELPPWPQPISATEAKFSIPYAVSVAFVDGEVGLGSFDDAHLNDERIRQFGIETAGNPVPGWGREHAASGRLAIGLADGTWREIEVIEALGTPNRAMSDQSLVEKFTNCAGGRRIR
jgi:2-methylcitrate dehydratase PrpD